MKKLIYLLGGTSEARALAAALLAEGCRVLLSVATGYGAALMEKRAGLEVLAAKLDLAAMIKLLKERRPSAVVDATHPYATEVTATAKAAAAAVGLPYFRLVRPEAAGGDYITAADFAEAAELLEQTKGPVFLTTGSKDLVAFTAVQDYRERIALRILPMAESLNKALALGYAPANIVCMQGPFDEDLDAATFAKYGARYVVTKDSGEAGGFSAKARAAARVGAKLIVIGRREKEEGSFFADIIAQLKTLSRGK